MNTIPINLNIEPNNISLDVGQDATKVVPMSTDTRITVIGGERYEGSYHFTPTDEAQVVPIAGLVANYDITIDPIPSNYGKISWDGSALTIT